MSRYRTVHIKFWRDDDVMDLTSVEKLTWLYILTGPQTTPFGLYVACPETMGIESGIGIAEFKKGFDKAVQIGFVEYDKKVRLVYLPSFLDYNPPQSINAMKSWAKICVELPSSELQVKLYGKLKAITEGMGEAMVEGFLDVWPKPKGKA